LAKAHAAANRILQMSSKIEYRLTNTLRRKIWSSGKHIGAAITHPGEFRHRICVFVRLNPDAHETILLAENLKSNFFWGNLPIEFIGISECSIVRRRSFAEHKGTARRQSAAPSPNPQPHTLLTIISPTTGPSIGFPWPNVVVFEGKKVL